MKKSHLFGIIAIAIAILVIITTAGDASTYVTFSEAKELRESGNDKLIHVVGELKKDANDEVVGIEPSPNHLSFSFVLVDDNKEEQLVYYAEPMPADFLKSEKVVIIGNYKRQEEFHAEKILLKCPSKYEENQLNSKQAAL